MDILWAPWRMDFITGRREEGCIFCKKPVEKDRLAENFVLHVGKRAFVILNRFPYHTGHLMVIPLRHTSDFTDLAPEENAEICVLLQQAIRALTLTYRPEGFNLGTNLGRPAGSGIHEHLHHHVVPRWIGDTNFFPLIAQTRSLPEVLKDTYDRLRPLFAEYETERSIAPGEPLPSARLPPLDTPIRPAQASTAEPGGAAPRGDGP